MRLVLFLTFALPLASADDGGMAVPQFNDKGELIRPRDTDRWTFVGSSIGLSYTVTTTPRDGPGLIHNVHTQPEAYREFLATGKFPEKTMFVLTLYKPEQKVSPNQNGYFQGDLVATEVSVKDSSRFKDGWAYFNFSGGSSLRESATAEAPGRCHACHKEHGMRDNVFVQFYPALRK